MAKSKKNLSLDKRLIKPVILDFFDDNIYEFEIGDFEEKNKAIGHYNIGIRIEDEEYDIDFYFKNNGLTTISYSRYEGTIVEELVEHIETGCKFTCTENKSNLKSISTDEIEILIEFLINEADAEIISKELTDSKIQTHFYKLKGPDYDELTITRFTTGRMTVQGRPLYLYNNLVSIIAELDLGKFDEFVGVDIDYDNIDTELKSALPIGFSKVGDKMKKQLSVAIALQQFDLGMNDYTYITFNALRSLEGHIKKVLIENNVPDKHCGSGEGISCFIAIRKNIYKFNHDICGHKLNEDEISVLEESYSFYHKHRHELFHQGGFLNNRVIKTMSEAKELVNNVMKHIDNYYYCRQ